MNQFKEVLVGYVHIEIEKVPSEGEVINIKFSYEGLFSILEVVYPAKLPQHMMLYHQKHVTIIFLYTREIREIGTCMLTIREADVPINTKDVSRLLDHILIDGELMFIGTSPIKYDRV